MIQYLRYSVSMIRIYELIVNVVFEVCNKRINIIHNLIINYDDYI